MQIKISGKNINVGAALKEYVETELDSAVSKYFDRAIFADVVFTKEAHLFVADIIANEGTGNSVLVKSQAKTDDIYSAFDSACQKLEKQLRRYKRKLVNHRRGDSEEKMASATKYILSDDGQDSEEGDNPLIIAEKQVQIEILTVSDAVMRMNLANLPALMFINKKTDGVNMVYRRNDGNISWVDSECQYNKAERAA